jgi:hypothetical protein
MNLTEKTELEVVNELIGYVKKGREIETTILHYLLEVERRKIFLARGFPSLFEFCLKVLGYSENEAFPRIQAMRLMRDVPVVEAKIDSGKLTMSVAAKAQACFRREAKKRKVSRDEKQLVIDDLCGMSLRKAEKKLASLYPGEAAPEKIRPVSDNSNRIEFSVSDEVLAKFNRLMDLMAHKNFDRRLDVFFEQLADMALEKLEPHDAPIRVAPKVKSGTRYIPASTQRTVKSHAMRGCNYIDPVSGRRCGARHGLQIDHIKELARGGDNSPGNLQLLCTAHNKFKSSRLSGKSNRPYDPGPWRRL